MKKDLQALEWINGNDLSYDIWNKKYRYMDENHEEWLNRVSGSNYDTKQLIKDKKFLFGGRILANRGLEKYGIKTTLSNCYVITPPSDSIEGIFEAATKMARTFSYGGGVGIDISNLRPKGGLVHNAAKTTSGAVSFMDLYSHITALVCQEGRRGALMLSMSCTHPDIIDFINLKSDLNVCTKANISVRMTDEFFQCVEKNEDFYLYWRSDNKELTQIDLHNKCSVITTEYNKLYDIYDPAATFYVKKVKAKEVLELLALRNWEMGEPGILYWDRISNYNILSNTDFKYAGVNPCLTGDTLIQTVEGEIPIQELVGKTPDVYCMDENGNLTIKKAIKVWKTRENAQIVEVITGKGKIRCTPDHRIYTTNRGWVEAINLQKGDKIKGLNRQTTGHKYCSVGLSGTKYEKEHRFIAKHYYDIDGMDVHHINDNGFDNRLSNLEVITHAEHSKLSNTNRQIEYNRDSDTGRFLPKEIHTPRDNQKLGKEVGTNWYVQSVTILDYTEDVYDMTVEDVHNFVANGMIVHNCAEEPLPAGGSCLLGSLNLSTFVKDSFTESAYIDVDDLIKSVKIAVRALNDVLLEGLPLHPLQEQRESVGDWRQIGLGITGLGDMLIRLGETYGSDSSLKVVDDVMKNIATTAVIESLEMAKEFGCYPKCEKEKLVESTFITNLDLPQNIKDEITKYGLYNSQLLTIAPTGTLSSLLSVSSGAEPNFAFKYVRRTISLNNEDTYYEVNVPLVEEYKTITDNTELPSCFISAEQIDFKNRIKMQSVLQKYIDASISSTLNLSEDVSVEHVYNIYLEGWKNGLKGCTIWRDNCKRTAILTKEQPKNEEDNKFVGDNDAEKRPKELEADFYTIKHKGIQYTIAVGILRGRPYEIFAYENNIKVNNLPDHKGVITKIGKNHYSFSSEHVVIDNLVQAASRQEERWITLTTSSQLRHCEPLKCIIKTLKKMDDTITSFPNALSRVLSKYLPKQKEKMKETCPECQGELVREGGCIQCKSCGWSKCG